MQVEPRSRLRTRTQARSETPGLRHEPAGNHRRNPEESLVAARSRSWKRRAGSTVSPRSKRRISSTASPMPTASFTSAPTGRTSLTQMTASAVLGAACPPCLTIVRSTKRPTRPIPSSSRPRRRATSSIRASTRRRPPSPAKSAHQRSCIQTTWPDSDCGEVTWSASATRAGKSACT